MPTRARQAHHQEDDEEIQRKRKEAEEKKRLLAKLKQQTASYEDVKMALLRRSKIEQWVDEPFFEKTLIGAFVRVGINKREVIVAEVKEIKDDENAMYALSNGKKTGKYLRLMLTEDKTDKVKWYKINQTSNQEISYQDFDRMV